MSYDYLGYEPKGWKQLLDMLLYEAQYCGIEVVQIKEKWGCLRVYFKDGTADPIQVNNFYQLTEDTEKVSAHICEFCGAPGRIQDIGHWMKACCNTCRHERLKQFPTITHDA